MPTNRRGSAVIWVGLVVACVASVGCGGDTSGGSGSGSDPEELEPVSPADCRLLDAGRPFALALVARDWAKAHALLSPLARRRMSVNQFSPADDDLVFAKREQEPKTHVSADDFARLMGEAEQRYGKPTALRGLHVHETDSAVLAGTATGKTAGLDRMFAIGNMPADIPGDLRRASLRGQIRTELSAEDLDAEAKRLGVTRAELLANEDFQPYFTLKLVLVEEGGELKVGYFELLPPSMLD